MPQPPHHQIPGVEAFRRLAAGPEILRRVDLRLDGGDDGVGDLVLYRENVGQLAVVTLRPEVAPDATSLSCTVIRTRSPLLRTLPSTR